MTTSDGSVIGATKFVDNGPDTSRYTLVLVAEGYQNSELTQFHQDCQDLVDHMYATPPFGELDLRCAFNVYRIDVASTDSGADDPTTCGGPGVSRATYFDATFCGDGKIERLLTVDSTSVINVVDANVTHHDRVIVIVNSTTYGGSGGSVAVTSKGGDWKNVAMHEMGHAVFGLADEYEYYAGCGSGETGHDTYTGPEFAQANISATSDRATIKWASLVAASTSMPTTTNADCTKCDPQGVPAGVTAATIGAWEGAGYNHCGAWRPAFNCMMRDLSGFCGVCQQRIRTVMAPYTQPTTVSLATPSITFNDVPAGMMTVRAARFSVTSCVSLTFRITSGPTVLSGPAGTSFGTPLGTVFPSPSSPGTPAARDAFAWISYTGTAAGDAATGTVTVHCDETNTNYVIPITANTVARPKVVVELVLDKSGSMEWDAGDGRKRIDVLHDSALPFADLLPDDDAVGIVSFDQDGHDVMPVTVAGPPVFGAGRTAAKAAISAHTPNPAGSTAIGDGVELGHNRLAPVTGYDAKAMIVLTDGQETDSKYIADVMSLITDRVFAIGLGTASEIDPVALTALTNGTGGYLLMTGTLDQNDFYRLAKYYLQILASVTNNDIVLDPDGWIAPGQKYGIPFVLNETDIEANVILLTPAPWAVRFMLETPDGDVIDPATASTTPGALFATAQNDAYYRYSLPALLPSGPTSPGTWRAILEVDEPEFRKYLSTLERDQLGAFQDAVAHGLRYNLNVHTFSNLRMSATLSQTGNEPGATLTLRVVLTEYGVPIDGRATVSANLEYPDTTVGLLVLPEVDPGVFETSVLGSMEGIYAFGIHASGTTLRGLPFTREQTLTAALWRGGNHTPPTTGDDPRTRDERLCALLDCLLSDLGPEALKRLEAYGIGVDAIRKCLAVFCGGHEPVDPTAIPGITIRPDLLEAIRRLPN
jgi:IgA peptidase M64/VWA domain-containing protein